MALGRQPFTLSPRAGVCIGGASPGAREITFRVVKGRGAQWVIPLGWSVRCLNVNSEKSGWEREDYRKGAGIRTWVSFQGLEQACSSLKERDSCPATHCFHPTHSPELFLPSWLQKCAGFCPEQRDLLPMSQGLCHSKVTQAVISPVSRKCPSENSV
jgi:hypothetical protein